MSRDLGRRLLAELVGGAVVIGVLRVLYPDVMPEEAAEVVLPDAA